MRVFVTTKEIDLALTCDKVEYLPIHNSVILIGVREMPNTDFTLDVVHDAENIITIKNVKKLEVFESRLEPIESKSSFYPWG